VIDPVIFLILTLCFSVLLLGAGQHKLRHRQQFRYIVSAYKLVPEALTVIVVITLGIVEVALGAAWLSILLMPWFSEGLTVLLATVTALVFLTYGAAMLVNLRRGRHYIDCGCHFSNSASSKNNDTGQSISWKLVVRNATLALASLSVLLPLAARDLGLLDYVSVFLALITLILVYAAAHQLLRNESTIQSWRSVDG